jgi:hypothetical protein
MEQDMKAVRPRIRTIDLGYDQLLIFDDGRGDRVRVLFGATWLTQEGDSGDTVMRQGTELTLCDGRTLIGALEPARLRIVREPVKARILVRVGALLRSARRWIRRLQLGPVTPELTS